MKNAKRFCSIFVMLALLATTFGAALAATGSVTANGVPAMGAPVYAQADSGSEMLGTLVAHEELPDLRSESKYWYAFTYRSDTYTGTAYIEAQYVADTSNQQGNNAPTPEKEPEIQQKSNSDAPQLTDEKINPANILNTQGGNDQPQISAQTFDLRINSDPTDPTDPTAASASGSTGSASTETTTTSTTETTTTTTSSTDVTATSGTEVTSASSTESTATTTTGTATTDTTGTTTTDPTTTNPTGGTTTDPTNTTTTDPTTTNPTSTTTTDSTSTTTTNPTSTTTTDPTSTTATDPTSTTTTGTTTTDPTDASTTNATATTTTDPTTPTTPTTPTQTQKQFAKVHLSSSTQRLRLYPTKDMGTRPLAEYPDQTIVEVVRRETEWTEVIAQGQQGFMLTKYLIFQKSDGTWEDVPDPKPTNVGKVSLPSNMSKLTLYPSPGIGGTPLGEYANETLLEVLNRGADWTQVKIGDKTGYMQTRYLAFQRSDGTWEGGNTPSSSYAYVYVQDSSQKLNLRDQPSTHYGNVIAQYYNGTRVIILDWDASWSHVRVEGDGQTGYMQTQYLSLTWPPSGGGGTTGYAVVNNLNPLDWLNLRAEPSTNGRILGQYFNGKVVRVISYGPSWTQVEVDGLIGYMMTQYLSFSGGGGGGGTTGYAVVNNSNPRDYLNLRAGPSTSTKSIGRYYNGTMVKILEYGSVWSRVEVEGKIGYMMNKYLSFNGGGGGGGGGGSYTYAVVHNSNPRDYLNLRARPSTSSSSIGQYYNGTSVKILSYGNEWCHVEVQGKTGYMMTRYLSFSGGGGGSQPSNPTLATVNSSARLNLRAFPSTSSSSLGLFYHGTIVKILEYGATWCRVQVNGINGYMMTRYLKIMY